MHPLARRFLRRTYPLYRPILTTLGLLDYMARNHRTDKYWHRYTTHYQHHFNPLRNKKLKIFEIGVGGFGNPHQGGESLRMWKDYFKRAEIYSIDIVDKTSLGEDRIHIFQGDQNDPAFLDDFGTRFGPFDLIIDDGSHYCEHVITSFRALFPHLKENGIYVIEDLFYSYDENLGGSPDDLNNSACTSLGMLKSLVDDMHSKYIRRRPQSYGDRITGITFYPKICFIQKGDNTIPDDYVDSHYAEIAELRAASAATVAVPDGDLAGPRGDPA
jgi:methyltransferase family protein